MSLVLKSKKHQVKRDYCLIGLSRFNYEIAKILMKEDQSVTVIDKDPQIIDTLGLEFKNSILCDAMKLQDLEDMGIQHFDYVIVGIDNIEKSISICSNLKELEVSKILAKAKNEIHKRILKSMGIMHSVIPELEVAENLAYQTMFDLEVEILQYSKKGEDIEHELFSTRLPVYNPRLWGQKIGALKFLSENNSIIVSIKRIKGGDVIIPVVSEDTIERADTVFLIARKESIGKLKNYFMKNIPIN